MTQFNSVTNTILNSLKRYGGVRFDLESSFNGATETYTSDVGPRVDNLPIRYNKIVGGVLVEMTQGEKDSTDAAIITNLSLLQNYYLVRYPKGEQELIQSDGPISLDRHATRLDTNGSGSFTMAGGELRFILKKVFNDNASVATITCNLDQSVAAYVSFSLAKSGKAELIWDFGGEFWTIIEEKNLTRNL